MSVIASQITSLTIVYLTLYSGTYRRKHRSYTSLALLCSWHQCMKNKKKLNKQLSFHNLDAICRLLSAPQQIVCLALDGGLDPTDVGVYNMDIYIYIYIVYKQFRIYSYFNDIVYRHASRWIQHLTDNVCQCLWITQYIPPWISYL